MNESWEDLLRRVYYAGYDDRQRERDYDPMDHKIVDTASIRAEKMEQRIRELADGLDAAIEINNAHVERELGYQHRISELESALQHIRDFYYSAEMCRDIAAAALDGRDDYQEPPR